MLKFHAKSDLSKLADQMSEAIKSEKRVRHNWKKAKKLLLIAHSSLREKSNY